MRYDSKVISRERTKRKEREEGRVRVRVKGRGKTRHFKRVQMPDLVFILATTSTR